VPVALGRRRAKARLDVGPDDWSIRWGHPEVSLGELARAGDRTVTRG